MRVVARPAELDEAVEAGRREARRRLRQRRGLPGALVERAGTSRCRSWPTRTATSCTCSSATARSSGATRRWWRSPPRRASTRRCATRSATRRCAWPARPATSNAGTVEFLVDADSGRLLLHRGQPAHPGRAHRHRDGHRHRHRQGQIRIAEGAALGTPGERHPGPGATSRLNGYGHPVPHHHRGPREQLHPRLRAHQRLPRGDRLRHPPGRRHRLLVGASSRRSTTRCW